jgi:pimeloyl-ACP methyl ester carboxylesterase
MSNIEQQAELPRYDDFLSEPELTAQQEVQDVNDYYDSQRDTRKHQWRKFFVATNLVIGLSKLAYDLDVAIADAQLAGSEASILNVYDSASAEHNDTMVAVMAGLGNRNSFATARALETYNQMGSVSAIDYDNKGVDPNVIAELITKKAQADGKTSLVLDGHSMGGLVAAAVAAHIYSGDSGLKIKAVILDCTPVNYDAVQDGQRTYANTLLNAVTFDKDKTLLRSHFARFIVEMAARKSNYFSLETMSLDPSAMLVSTEKVIRDKILSPDAASGMLIGSQIGMIVGANMADSLQILGSTANGKKPPIIFFEQPSDVFNDPVVKDNYSRRFLEDLTAQYGERFSTFYTDGGHADPIQAHDTYNGIAAIMGVVVNEIPKETTNALTLAYPPSKVIAGSVHSTSPAPTP